ncbi:MAG: DUF2828 family protein [Oscillospiraceae bacterium]|nr:DUF2828 family protein [Oscillospiraceae bacterium]
MLKFLTNESNRAYTENGALTNRTSGCFCLDLFFKAGAMRGASELDIANAVTRAYAEDPVKTLKIVFFARDVRGGLGERRFFSVAVRTLADIAPEAVDRNVRFFAEYGRYDDLLSLLGTSCERAALDVIKSRLNDDLAAFERGEPISLLAKWLPSVNTSSEQARSAAKHIARSLKLTEKEYRQTLSKLRKYTDIIENRLRVRDYSFSYAKQTSGAMLKYRRAFMRNDCGRYLAYLKNVQSGKETMHADTLYPYQIVRGCFDHGLTAGARLSLDTTWKSLPVFGESGNAIAVVDGSGSMYCNYYGGIRPIDAAMSLGIYFAEHNKGVFANRFITFSSTPRLVEIKGADIVEKVRYCSTFNEISDTNLEAVFKLILSAAIRGGVPQSELPERIYIISDMEFNSCIYGGNDLTLFAAAEKMYARHGYRLPEIVFWNVNSRSDNIPVTMSQTGAALVSGATPAIFDMVAGGDLSPEIVMNSVIESERYKQIS